MVVIWRVCHHKVWPRFNDGLLDNGRQFGVRREAAVREIEKAGLNRKQGSRLFGFSPASSSELVRVSHTATGTVRRDDQFDRVANRAGCGGQAEKVNFGVIRMGAKSNYTQSNSSFLDW